jgi:uncharacterized membrane protein
MAPDKTGYFDLELSPNRSLAPRHFRLLLLGVAALFLAVGVRLLVLGAWPVIPFLIADVLLLAWAMRASYRSGGAREHLRLDGRGLELVRVAADGQVHAMRLEAARARVELETVAPGGNRLWLTAGGRREAVGAFLSPGEREALARVMADGLARFRSGERQ